MRKIIPLICVLVLGAGVFPAAAISGGLSQDTVRFAMCGDVLMQCRQQVRQDFKCKDEDDAACWNLRLLPERKCDYLYKNCMSDIPVKSIKPVFRGKKEY